MCTIYLGLAFGCHRMAQFVTSPVGLGSLKKQLDHVVAALEVLADESSAVAALIDTRDDYRIVWANRQLVDFLRSQAGVSPLGMRWGGRCPFAFGINAPEVLDEVVETGEPAR